MDNRKAITKTNLLNDMAEAEAQNILRARAMATLAANNANPMSNPFIAAAAQQAQQAGSAQYWLNGLNASTLAAQQQVAAARAQQEQQQRQHQQQQQQAQQHQQQQQQLESHPGIIPIGFFRDPLGNAWAASLQHPTAAISSLENAMNLQRGAVPLPTSTRTGQRSGQASGQPAPKKSKKEREVITIQSSDEDDDDDDDDDAGPGFEDEEDPLNAPTKFLPREFAVAAAAQAAQAAQQQAAQAAQAAAQQQAAHVQAAQAAQQAVQQQRARYEQNLAMAQKETAAMKRKASDADAPTGTVRGQPSNEEMKLRHEIALRKVQRETGYGQQQQTQQEQRAAQAEAELALFRQPHNAPLAPTPQKAATHKKTPRMTTKPTVAHGATAAAHMTNPQLRPIAAPKHREAVELAGPFVKPFLQPSDPPPRVVHQNQQRYVSKMLLAGTGFTSATAPPNVPFPPNKVHLEYDQLQELGQEMATDAYQQVSEAVRKTYSEMKSRHEQALSSLHSATDVQALQLGHDKQLTAMRQEFNAQKVAYERKVKKLQKELSQMKERQVNQKQESEKEQASIKETNSGASRHHAKSLEMIVKASIASLRTIRAKTTAQTQ